MYILINLQVLTLCFSPPVPLSVQPRKSTQFSTYGQYQQTPLLGNLPPTDITATLQGQIRIKLHTVRKQQRHLKQASQHDAMMIYSVNFFFCVKCTIIIKNNESFSSASCVTIQKTQAWALVHETSHLCQSRAYHFHFASKGEVMRLIQHNMAKW